MAAFDPEREELSGKSISARFPVFPLMNNFLGLRVNDGLFPLLPAGPGYPSDGDLSV